MLISRMSKTSFTINNFNPLSQNINLFRCFLWLASTGGGKTTGLYDFLFHHKDKFISGMAIAGSPESRAKWETALPKGAVHYEYSKEIIDLTVKTQDARANVILSERNEMTRGNPGNAPPFDKPRLILVDDYAHAPEIFKTESVQRICQQGRHLGLSFHICTQYYTIIEKKNRSNVGYCFLGKFPDESARKIIYESFFEICGNRRVFNALYNKAISLGALLVVDNVSTSDKLQDRIFFYRVDKSRLPYQLGSPGWRKKIDKSTKKIQSTSLKNEKSQIEKEILERKLYMTSRKQKVLGYTKPDNEEKKEEEQEDTITVRI